MHGERGFTFALSYLNWYLAQKQIKTCDSWPCRIKIPTPFPRAAYMLPPPPLPRKHGANVWTSSHLIILLPLPIQVQIQARTTTNRISKPPPPWARRARDQANLSNGGKFACSEAWSMMFGEEHRSSWAIGLMRGITVLCPRRSICISQSRDLRNLPIIVSYSAGLKTDVDL